MNGNGEAVSLRGGVIVWQCHCAVVPQCGCAAVQQWRSAAVRQCGSRLEIANLATNCYDARLEPTPFRSAETILGAHEHG